MQINRSIPVINFVDMLEKLKNSVRQFTGSQWRSFKIGVHDVLHIDPQGFRPRTRIDCSLFTLGRVYDALKGASISWMCRRRGIFIIIIR